MDTWKLLAFTVPLFFVSYQALSKAIPKGTSIFLLNAYASLIGFAFMLALHFLTQPQKSLNLPSKSLIFALSIGLLISLGNFGIIKAYSLGAPQSLFTILFYVILIIYGVIIGLLIFHERLTLVQFAGMVLALIGVFMAVFFKK